MSPLSRRRLLLASGGLALGTTGLGLWQLQQQPAARVVTLRAPDYGAGLAAQLEEGLRALPTTAARVRGARVLLKPNLVEFSPERPINTDPRFVGALAVALLRLGAREVRVGEGPGHRRDTEALVEHSGLGAVLRELGLRFVDLNVDTPVDRPLAANLTGLGRLSLAGQAVGADLLVSVAKLKTHHWAGATLSMKNLFGVVPSAVYGWPKNPLHWAGIDASITDLWLALRPGLAVIDGIVGMEGDGPIMGEAVPMGCVLLGEQCPAVDATAARLMGLRPERMPYLREAAARGGTLHPLRVEVVGDAIAPRPFRVLDHLAHLRA